MKKLDEYQTKAMGLGMIFAFVILGLGIIAGVLTEHGVSMAFPVCFATSFVMCLIPIYIYNTRKIQNSWKRFVCTLKKHDSGPPFYSKDYPPDCMKFQRCKRCDSLIHETIPHDILNAKVYFTPGGYHHEDQCIKKADCANCGIPVILETGNHDEQSGETACETYMECRNCKRKRILQDRHEYAVTNEEYGEREYWGGDLIGRRSSLTLTCTKCGSTKYESVIRPFD